MSIKYFKRQLIYLMFFSWCVGFFGMLAALFLRLPSQLTLPMYFILIPMCIATFLASVQMIKMYRYIVRYIEEKCWNNIIEDKTNE